MSTIYKNLFKQYVDTGNIDAEENLNAITFINFGTGTVTLNDTVPIAAGATFIVGGNAGEIDKTNYNVSFAAGAVTNSLVVISKIIISE